MLVTDDVRIILIKDGDHRLSRPQDLELLVETLDSMTNTVEGGKARRMSLGTDVTILTY
jgi:hypothetical protein